ncbi:MAG: hypothetical protein JMDDDDMK_04236 [Acidobacteria bacterium]|nr:hypothetical protein [Acidobacteriota bacterium]
MKWLLMCCVAVLILTSARMQRVEEVHSCRSLHSKRCLLSNNGLMTWMSMVVVKQDSQVLPRASPQSLTVKRKSTIIDRSAKYGVSFAISHDGRTLATTGSHNKIVLWDIATERAIAELQTSPPWAPYLLFSPDDRWFMARTPKGEVSVWEAKTWELKAHIVTGYKDFRAEVFIDWRNWLLATADDRKPLIKLWDLRTGQIVRTLEHPSYQTPYNIFHPERETETKDMVIELAFTLDGRKLLSVSFLFNRIYVWDLESGTLERTLDSHRSTIYRMVLDPTGRYLATPSRDGTAGLWDLRTMERISSIGDFRGRVLSAAFGPDGRTLAVASADQDRKVKLWDVEGNRLIATLTGFKKNVVLFNENFSPDGKIVAVPSIGSYKPGLKLWDTKTGQLLATIDEAMQPVAFTPDGKTMLTGGPKSEVLLWDIIRN